MQKSFPLDMAPDSVDDMYRNCAKTMHKKVNDTYLKKELKNNDFYHVWQMYEGDAIKKYNNKDAIDKDLTVDHFKALNAYTADKIYKKFNKEVKTKGPVYTSGFSYHALHFLLSDAILILKQNQPEKCLTTYRRTAVTFNGQVNTNIRFGSFASS